ncbi:MAG: glycosyltransferase family 4 protein [Cyclobacteriaceae bacterium]
MTDKKIVFIASHYYPETGAPAKRIFDATKYLSDNGWKVTVFTLAPHYPENKIHKGYDRGLYDKRIENGFEVIRVRPWMVPKTSFILRMLSETLFAFQAAIFIFLKRKSLIYSTSPYMFLGPIPLIAAKIKGSKFVWEVRDLTWEYAKTTSKKTYGLVSLIEKIMKWTASTSDGLVTATEGILKYFKNKPNLKEVIYNGVATENVNLFKIANAPIFKKERPMALYAGIVGYAQNLITFLETARINRNYDFFIVGDGPEKSYLEEYALTHNINNIFFEGYMPQADLLQMYKKADVLVAMLKDDPTYAVAQPSKLWEYMCTGKPVIYSGNGEAHQIISKNQCGIAIKASDPTELSEALNHLKNNVEFAEQLGKKGFDFVLENRMREKSLYKLNQLLESYLKK